MSLNKHALSSRVTCEVDELLRYFSIVLKHVTRVNGLTKPSVKSFQHLQLCYDARGEFFVSIKSCGDNHCCPPGGCSGLSGLFYWTRVGNLGVLPRTDISCGMDSGPTMGIDRGSIVYLLFILQ